MGCSAGSSPQGGCRDSWDLDNNNVYARSRCNNGWCAHMYGYYFEKDFRDGLCAIGHRHDWEHVVIWTRNDKVEFVSASRHGGYQRKAAKNVRFEGNHAKIVYHRDDDNGGTHAMRFGNSGDDKIENHKGRWFAGPLVSYFGFPSVEVRNKMMRHDWGSASVAMRDQNFAGQLEKARPGEVTGFQTGQDAPDGHNSPGRPSGCGSCC